MEHAAKQQDHQVQFVGKHCYMCSWIYMRTHMYTHAHVFIVHTHTHARTHTHTDAIHTHTHTHTHTHAIQTHTHTHTHAIQTHTHARHTDTHTHTPYRHTHTHTPYRHTHTHTHTHAIQTHTHARHTDTHTHTRHTDTHTHTPYRHKVKTQSSSYLPLQHAMVLEKIKYIQSEKDNELSYLNKELSSVKQKCSLLEMSVEDHQAESNRLKRELSEIEMSHKLEREKVRLLL